MLENQENPFKQVLDKLNMKVEKPNLGDMTYPIGFSVIQRNGVWIAIYDLNCHTIEAYMQEKNMQNEEDLEFQDEKQEFSFREKNGIIVELFHNEYSNGKMECYYLAQKYNPVNLRLGTSEDRFSVIDVRTVLFSIILTFNCFISLNAEPISL
ncbi:hypothetical protein K501DRAFT_275792 [Backusella circina FSU 941]|nr:hypothetical protein K501DRAFT_275792 [Backusella circina FSU 941]